MLNRESTIQILYSETSGVTPDSTLLKDGELAINAADEKLFFKGSDNGLKEFNSSTHSVSSINGETGDITKLYGSFRNTNNIEYTSTSGVSLGTSFYNSDDASGLTLVDGYVEINKAGVYKISTDFSVGSTGSALFGPIGVKSYLQYYVTVFGNQISAAVTGTDMYSLIPRTNPGGSRESTSTSTSNILFEVTQNTLNNSTTNLRIAPFSTIDYGTIGSGSLISPSGGTRMTIEEL